MTLEVANVHAFARLYGVLRWFHPSDAAAATDWDQFAVRGVQRVLALSGTQSLADTLLDLIKPIAPTAHILRDGQRSSTEEQGSRDLSANGSDVVTWEHVGYGDSTLVSEYASKRRNRERVVAVSGHPFAAISQKLDATPLRGQRIRLRGQLRTANHGLGRLFLRIDAGKRQAFFENMRERPSVAPSWTMVEISARVDPDATQVVFGTVMTGAGTVWYDDLSIEVAENDGSWKSIEVADSGFESGDLFAHWKPGTGGKTGTLEGWDATLDHSAPARGDSALRVQPAMQHVSHELFDEGPLAGERVAVDLGLGLRAEVPLSLYSRDGHTVGDEGREPPNVRAGARDGSPTYRADAGIADVVVVWNVFQHFWPYWDVVKTDWASELDKALAAATRDRSMDDHSSTLRRLIARAPDGHASVICYGETPQARPAFQVDIADGKVAVLATGTDAVRVGDIVVAVEGRPVAEYLAASTELISGSPQWRMQEALERFGAGREGRALNLRLRRGDTEISVSVPRVAGDHEFKSAGHPPIDLQTDGVYYVDLTRATMQDVEAIIGKLAAAPGVVFDMRDVPNAIHDVLGYLVTDTIDLTRGLSISHVIRPDHLPSSIGGKLTSDAPIRPTEPHLRGRIAFLVGAGTISYGETVMAQVEQYHLGAIVGSLTAGTNGNKAEITTPTGCRVTFTGALAMKPDGRQLHLAGIQPTIPASRTVAGVIAGRDEVLERALVYVRTGK